MIIDIIGCMFLRVTFKKDMPIFTLSMSKGFITYLTHLWQSVVFLAIAMFLLGIFRFYGIDDDEAILIKIGFEDTFNPANILPMFALTGTLIGVMFASIEFIFDTYASKRIPLGIGLLIKTFLYFAIMIIISTSVLEFASNLYDINVKNDLGWWRTDKTFWVVIIYVTLASVVFSFIKIANEKFGKGVFIKMLFGKYKNPKEEKRIFMFLDLKSSTTIAESLGHYKYSQLIQDCFYDLNDVVPKYEAEIYQYVGDEAVLSWPYKKGLINNNCVALFFEFQRILKSRVTYYQQKYNLMPEFKAGLHGGVLMVAEVGVVKKELAFHGDVINTSARIQAECNIYGVEILISKKLKEDLNTDNKYKTQEIGSVLLKGKKKEVSIFTLSPL